ncbi:hypothetical protein [Streptomyces mirabilis]|uniref:hypothetical protein n=1 Tax=Streptomyces mirabilis TaxID=68239 RepID=UPI0036DB4C25
MERHGDTRTTATPRTAGRGFLTSSPTFVGVVATAGESTVEPGAARRHWDNKEILTTAIEELFNQHDVTAVDRY